MAMEAKDIFEAASRNVRELLSERGLGLYIPPYQRPFGWDKDKVFKLVEDTLHGYATLVESEESFTFLGTVITIHDINFTTIQPIVRPDVPGKVLTVIDGQQRLTTLLIFCIALHNHIRVAHAKLIKSKKPEALTEAERWIDGQSRRVIDELQQTFIERQAFGDAPLYPRMIRSFDDQWSRSKTSAQYNSPIAYLISVYSATLEVDKPTEFKPQKRDGTIEGEEALVDRYLQISRILKNLNGSVSTKDELDELPTLQAMAADVKVQRALLNHDFPEDVRLSLANNSAPADFKALLQLVLIACYTLNRVALTVVRGKNEDYAFTVFESLNTTGEPLTAFETFKPRVVLAETLQRFEVSESREHLSNVSNYLSIFKVGEPLQNATRDLLIAFAAAETGYKLSKRLADQRRYLKDEFERYESQAADRVAFVRHLRDVANFTQYAWTTGERQPSLPGLPVDATTDAIKLCLAFLSDLNHSVTIAPMVRFYSRAILAPEAAKTALSKEVEGAIKAVAAFSALWRASRRGTKNIDQQYRDILIGNSLRPALARSLRRISAEGALPPQVDLTALKADLRRRLAEAEDVKIADRDQFITEASVIPAYTNSRPVARFILLAAHHDAVEDHITPGFIKKGKEAVSPCLTYAGFKDERHLSLEHIAPREHSNGWDKAIYANRELVHRIGNLVLVPSDANSSLSNRPWDQKRILYKALGAASHDAAENIIASAGEQEIEFADSTQEIVNLAAHMPQLSSLGNRTEPWTHEFAEERSKRLLGLAWDELYAWLQ